MKLSIHSVCIAVFLYLLCTCFSGTFYVDDDAVNDSGPGDSSVSDLLEDGSPMYPFDAIQEAIDAADPNDIVFVADGTYTGVGNRDIDFGGKCITVRSENGPDCCIIDCQGSEEEPHRGFVFRSGEDSGSILRGLKIINGYPKTEMFQYGENGTTYGVGFALGSAILCRDSSPTISNCIIEHSISSSSIACFSASPIIEGTLFKDNQCSSIVGLSDSSPIIDTCSFINNNCKQTADYFFDEVHGENSVSFRGAGTVCFSTGESLIENCLFLGNTGYYNGGVTMIDSKTTIQNCTFAGNRSEKNGCLFFYAYEDTEPQEVSVIDRCIFQNNCNANGPDIFTGKSHYFDPYLFPEFGISTSYYYKVNYSCVEGLDADLPGIGNIDTDPAFVDAGYWDDWGTGVMMFGLRGIII